jgi:outer membrane protein assembly factor BamB
LRNYEIDSHKGGNMEMGMRIQHTRLLLGLLMVTCLALSACANNSVRNKEKLSMFRGDLQHSGMYDTKGPDQFNGVKWKFKTEGPVRSSPVLLDGILYIGSDDQSVYAIEEESGTQKWSFKTKGAVKSSPSIAEETVYIYSDDGSIYALHAADGTLKWSYNTEEKDDTRDQVDYWKSSPAISDGVLYIGGGNNTFFAIDTATGTLLWKKSAALNDYTCESCPPPFLHSSPAVYDGVVFVGVAGYDISKQKEPGTVIAYDAKSGDQLWISDILGGAVDSSPVVDEVAIYIGMRNSGLQSLDRKTGKALWKTYSIPYVLASPAIDQQTKTLYSGSSDSHELASIDAETGEKKWSYKTEGPIHSSPATDGTTVYGAGGNHYTDKNLGVIYALDAITGEEKWTFRTEGNIYSSPALNNGILYIGSDDGNVYAIE